MDDAGSLHAHENIGSVMRGNRWPAFVHSDYSRLLDRHDRCFTVTVTFRAIFFRTCARDPMQKSQLNSA